MCVCFDLFLNGVKERQAGMNRISPGETGQARGNNDWVLQEKGLAALNWFPEEGTLF